MRPPRTDPSPAERVGELFEEAIVLPSTAREAFLDEACVGDPGMRAELRSLLDAGEAAPGYLEKLAEEVLPAAVIACARLPLRDVEPGQRLAQYEIVGVLGRGGMGVVYRAHDTRLDRPVALKFLPAHLAADPSARERLLYEARAASAIDHPSICTIYEVGELDPDRLFLALAYYEGETLKEKIARAPLPLEETVALTHQIADGLAAAHRRGIVHRDIKPSNVIVTEDGAVKILDFGIAKVRDSDLLQAGTTVGTIAYMSPEQTRGELIDGRTDVWSLGVVVYEMLTGRRPFEGASGPAIIDAVRNQDPTPADEFRPDVPPLLAQLVRTCLQKYPAARYQRADELLTDVRAIEAESGLAGGGSLHLRRIAVLPLARFTPDPDDAYLADGVTEELIGRFSTLSGLRVIARASTMPLKDTSKSPTEIGRELGVDAVLQGGVGRESDQVRLSLRLMDVANARQVWATERRLAPDEFPSAVRAIAWEIAAELDVRLRAGERRQLSKQGTENPTAYALYLKGRYFWNKRAATSVQQARDCFQEALDLDPLFAQAWTGLADAFSVLGSYSVLPPEEAHPRARAAAERALAIDDELAEAHASLATTLADHFWDWKAAGRHYRRALELNPSYATARLWYGGFLRDLGRFDEALAEVRIARELDPLSLPIQAAEGITLYVARRYDEAIAVYRKLLEITPSFTFTYFLMALSYVQQGRYREALDLLQKMENWSGAASDVKSLSGFVHVQLGEEPVAREILAGMEQQTNDQYVSPFHRAVVHVALGEHDRAVELLRWACEARSKQARLLRVEPLLDPLRTDARFQDLLKEMGLADDDVSQALAP